jgi:hypothetical protein
VKGNDNLIGEVLNKMDVNQYVSVPEISKRLGISHVAVRKRIKSMQIKKLNPIPNVAVIHVDDYRKIEEAVKLRKFFTQRGD